MVASYAGHGSCWRVVARRNSSLLFLAPEEIWAFEATGRLTFVHCAAGRFDVDVSLNDIEGAMGPSLLRVHRAWLVMHAQIRELQRVPAGIVLVVGRDASYRGIDVPVARDRTNAVREALLKNTIGVRIRREHPDVECVEPKS